MGYLVWDEEVQDMDGRVNDCNQEVQVQLDKGKIMYKYADIIHISFSFNITVSV